MSSEKYLGVVVSITGRIFAHPADGTPEADRDARERGDYPYTHLYQGDDVIAIIEAMRDEDQEDDLIRT